MARLPVRALAGGAALAACFAAGAAAQQQMAPFESEPDPAFESVLQAILKTATKAVQDGDRESADLWMTRYMGLTVFNEHTERGYPDLIPLFQQRADLVPTAVLPGGFSEDFVQFFIQAPQMLYGVADKLLMAEDRVFAVRTYTDEQYYIQVQFTPVLQAWSLERENPTVFIVPLAAVDPPALLAAGTLKDGEPDEYFPPVALNAGSGYIHYVWPIELHDLEGDGKREIWLRYNVAGATGFTQRLDIYRIEESSLSLVRRFEGDAEGIARRLPDGSIEIARGASSDESQGHLGYDVHRFETLEYRDGEFVKTAERSAPHLLFSEEWRKYYFNKP